MSRLTIREPSVCCVAAFHAPPQERHTPHHTSPLPAPSRAPLSLSTPVLTWSERRVACFTPSRMPPPLSSSCILAVQAPSPSKAPALTSLSGLPPPVRPARLPTMAPLPAPGTPLVDPALLSARREDAGYEAQQRTLAAQLESARTEVRRLPCCWGSGCRLRTAHPR